MDVTSNITCLLIDVCSIASEAVLPEKSDDKEEIQMTKRKLANNCKGYTEQALHQEKLL